MLQSVTLFSGTVTTVWNSGVMPMVDAVGANISISSVTGTSPTIDITLEESKDNGLTWAPVYQFPRAISATNLDVWKTSVNSRMRFSWVTGGGTPSFTLNITVNIFDTPAPTNPHSFYDRTIVANTLNSVTPTFDIEGCRNVTAVISSGVATVPAVFSLQVSSDGINWATASSSITSIASINVIGMLTAWVIGKFARLIVATAWTAQTLNYVHIYWN